MAALLAAAAEPIPPTPSLELQSSGVILICGRDDTAVEAGNLLKDHLDVTVLIEPPALIVPPRSGEFPIAKGRVIGAKGHLGAFEIMVEDFAEAAPSSRNVLTFSPSRNNARSTCDVVLDLTGGPALFSSADHATAISGRIRPIPRRCCTRSSRRAIWSAALRSPAMSSSTPGYVAHSRSQRTGCTRCLDLCPARAISAAGDHVAIDANICAGCGQCAAACPTGAASYALPPEDALMRRLRSMLITFRKAGGERAVVLFHDEAHGAPLIDALARFGDGLPANVLPFQLNEITQLGLESITAAIAYGASAVRLLLRAKPRHDVSGLSRTIAVADPILVGLGFAVGRIATIETDDPDNLLDARRAIFAAVAGPAPGELSPGRQET